ncbi:TPA: hypothetical protein DEP21_04420 [Patescibacteria group bacterium]|nr:hypothetical protein [Candidatus Gracilibacteria bacterium]
MSKRTLFKQFSKEINETRKDTIITTIQISAIPSGTALFALVLGANSELQSLHLPLYDWFIIIPCLAIVFIMFFFFIISIRSTRFSKEENIAIIDIKIQEKQQRLDKLKQIWKTTPHLQFFLLKTSPKELLFLKCVPKDTLVPEALFRHIRKQIRKLELKKDFINSISEDTLWKYLKSLKWLKK